MKKVNTHKNIGHENIILSVCTSWGLAKKNLFEDCPVKMLGLLVWELLKIPSTFYECGSILFHPAQKDAVLCFHIFTFYRWCCFSLIFTKQEFFERKRQQKNNVRSTAPREVKKLKARSQDLFSLEVIVSAHRSAEKTGRIRNTAWIADNFVDSSWWPISVPRKMTDCFSYTAPPLSVHQYMLFVLFRWYWGKFFLEKRSCWS